MSRPKAWEDKLEEEAKEFLKERAPLPLDKRTYLAGCALSGLLARSPNLHGSQMEEIKKEAFRWADEMLRE